MSILQTYSGAYGLAQRASLPDIPRAAETVCHWLLTAPQYHPLWSQYVLCVVRLRDVPGFPPPHRQFDGATHEMLVVALNPEYGDVNVLQLADPDFRWHHLVPVNHAHQLEATDAEVEELADLAARAVVSGVLNPETADAPERIRHSWLTALTKTLAHIRGEEHAP